MGYDRHHAIVVTNCIRADLETAHTVARDLGCAITDIGPEVINGFRSFLVCPDGSKEGWTESSLGDSARARFIKWLQEQEYDDGSSPFDWVEVQFGDDDLETRVCDDSDRLSRVRRREREGTAI